MDRAMSNRLDPTFVRAQIELLRVTHPYLWEQEGDELLLSDMLEGSTDLYQVLARILDYEHEAENFVVSLDMRIAAYKARMARFEQRVDGMRSLMLKLLQHAGVRKVELPAATLSIRAGQPRVIITDEARLPEQFVRIEREPDKHLIASHLKAGERVDGAELSNSEETLAVRVK